ncbi:MAG: hypothetical protein AAF348_07490 [Bacteroidota bacterium]
MGTLLKLSQNLQLLKSRDALERIVFALVREYEEVFIRLNKEQLSQGRDIFNIEIGTYSRATEIESLFGEVRPIRPKTEGEPYNFEWTGGLFEGMELRINNNVAVFTSTDSKTDILVSKYGDIFGLTDDNLREVVQNTLLPALRTEICRTIGLAN